MLIQFFLLEAGSADLLYFLLLSIVALIIVAFIVRWIFRINEMVANMSATTWLLICLCRKNGVDEKQIEEIKKVFKIK
jgi:ABC-type iron transport system FetAB permease component